jgi:hypothetical protein
VLQNDEDKRLDEHARTLIALRGKLSAIPVELAHQR